jgi:hypothetical protein
MSARTSRSADWKAVAEIRALQSRAAEMAAARAGAERTAAADRHQGCEAALDEAHRGWVEALEGAGFDPGLARHWYADVGRKEAEERAAGEALAGADRRLEDQRAAWHGAQARADTADTRQRSASAAEARRRDEERLAAVEDRASRQRRPE